MKIPKLLSLVALVVLIQPSFACGCGGYSSTKPEEIIMRIVLLVIYLIPSVYFLFCFRRKTLSLWVLIISHSLMLLQVILGNQEAYRLFRPILNYISEGVVISTYILMLSLIWLFPAFYAYLKVDKKNLVSDK